MLFKKHADATLDYRIDWTAWLKSVDDDTIATSEYVLEEGIDVEGTFQTEYHTTIVLSGGGDVGMRYMGTNTIVTAGGLTDFRTFFIQII